MLKSIDLLTANREQFWPSLQPVCKLSLQAPSEASGAAQWPKSLTDFICEMHASGRDPREHLIPDQVLSLSPQGATQHSATRLTMLTGSEINRAPGASCGRSSRAEDLPHR